MCVEIAGFYGNEREMFSNVSPILMRMFYQRWFYFLQANPSGSFYNVAALWK